MQSSAILTELTVFTGNFPLQAVQAARKMHGELAPHFLEALLPGPRAILQFEDDYFLYQYALFLLAEYREPLALPVFIDFFGEPGPAVMELMDDFVPEYLSSVLASVADGRLEEVGKLVEGTQCNEFVRSAALEACTFMLAAGQITREQCLDYFRRLADGLLERKPHHIWSALAAACVNIRAGEMIPLMGDAYRDGLIELDYLSHKEFRDYIQRPLPRGTMVEILHRPSPLIENTVEEMSGWHCFHVPANRRPNPMVTVPDRWRESPAKVASGPKVGRNAPCPCGSGKKFKKCCREKGVPEPGGSLKEHLDNAYRLLHHAPAEAAVSFAMVWDLLGPLMNSAMTSLEDLQPLIPPATFIEDLVYDRIDLLSNLAGEAEGYAEGYADKGCEFCRFLLEQFTAECDNFQQNVGSHLGEFHFLAGRPNEGEKALLRVIQEHPDHAAGYVRLAGSLGDTPYSWNDGRPLGDVRAIDLLEQAVARPVVDGEDFDLEMVLEDMKQLLRPR